MAILRLWLVSLLAGAPALAGPTFTVTFDKSIRDEPATGRLVVYLIRDGAGVSGSPADGPFWEDPQPLFGTDVKGLAPGAPATLDDVATAFPVKLSQLPKGRYRAQAVLDLHHDNSEWKREPGNLYSDSTTITIGEAGAPESIPLV